jgi:hypothetical protein
MDEVDMLRAVRDDLSAPLGGAKAKARQALLAYMGARHEQSRRRTLLRVGAAVALAALIVIVGAPWQTRELSTANAAALLNGLASIAAAQPAAPATAAGYRYTKVESTNLNMMVVSGGDVIAVMGPKTREMWIAADGSGRIRETAGEAIFLNERGRTAWLAIGSPQLNRAINQNFGPGGLSHEDLARLPTDPVALGAVIRERASHTKVPIDDEMFVVIGDLLRQQEAPPAVRAALYKVAAGIPGVELIGDARDHSGRPGVAVAKTSSYTGLRHRNVLIFDPRTSALLGEEDVLLEPATWVDAQPPVLVGYSVYLDTRVVQSLPRE